MSEREWTPSQMRELVDYLSGPEGCNFREDEDGPMFDCDHTLTKTHAWLEAHGYDSDAVLAVLQSLGGLCDCQVVLFALLRVQILNMHAED